MAKALIVGSVALDTIQTPHGTGERILGGSASFGSVAASYFTEVSMVGVVGTDFPGSAVEQFKARGIDVQGLEMREGRTFHWSGYYEYDMNQAHTNATELNVFADFSPRLSAEQRKIPYVFLANIHPQLQLDVLEQMESPRLVAIDTMNFWIEGYKEELTQVIQRSDFLLMNDGEARQYCECPNLIECGQRLRALGPSTVAIKKGEHGALLFHDGGLSFFPSYPVIELKDPTGAGDTFAGALIGYLARKDDTGPDNLVRAVQAGTCMASFVVEDFSLTRVANLGPGELRERVATLRNMVRLPEPDEEALESRLAPSLS